jgi:hypothetical protein
MKQTILSLLILVSQQIVFAQYNGPREITPAVLQQIKSEVEKGIPAFKQQLIGKDYTKDEIEFAVDTFRIAQILEKRMDIDYSTPGMNRTVNEMTDAYDRLMNKYYNKLLKCLQ